MFVSVVKSNEIIFEGDTNQSNCFIKVPFACCIYTLKYPFCSCYNCLKKKIENDSVRSHNRILSIQSQCTHVWVYIIKDSMISDYNYSKQTYDFMFHSNCSFVFFLIEMRRAFTFSSYSCSHINRFKYLIAIKSGLVNQTFWKANCTLWLWCITICISNIWSRKKNKYDTRFDCNKSF